MNWAQKLHGVAAPAATAAMMMLVAIVATGAPARPIQTNYPDWSLKWDYVLPRMLDLENQGVSMTSLGHEAVAAMTAAALAVWLALIAIAVRRRDSVAGGMLIGPLAVFLVLLIGGGRAAAFQMIGTYYPFLMCGTILLIDGANSAAYRRPTKELVIAEGGSPGASARGYHKDEARGSSLQQTSETSPWRRRLTVAGISLLALIALGLRTPRYVGALKRYAGPKAPATLQFSEPDAERLATRIGNQTVEVDVIEPQRAIFLLVELGRHEGIHFRWSPRSWDTTVGYTRWPVPSYPSPVALKLVPAGESHGLPVLFKSRQYELIDSSGVAAARDVVNTSNAAP